MGKYFKRLSRIYNIFHFLLFRLTILLFFLFLACKQNNDNQTLSTEKIYKDVSGAVVVIHSYDSNNELSNQGSGVVINDKGYVVTNYHVFAGNDRLEIIHNKEIVPYADIIGIDEEKDILILKIQDKKFPSIKIGDSKTLTIGQRVYAIGSPLGFENSISEGIVSGLRSDNETGRDFIQITASISPGSSGGAVINDKGELIGISTLTLKEGQNLNFAIPINDVLDVEIDSYSKNNAYKESMDPFVQAILEMSKGNYQEAIKYYSIGIKRHPNDASQYTGRGNAKNYLEDYLGAIQDYNIAIKINPNDVDTYTFRGMAKSDLGDYRGAIQDYNKAIEIDPNDANAYFQRGLAKTDLKNYRGAIQDCNIAIKLDPNDAAAYNNRGIAKDGLGDYRGAIQDYNKAIEIDPNDAAAYFNRGNAKSLSGDKSGACLDWSKAGELGNIDAYDLIREVCD